MKFSIELVSGVLLLVLGGVLLVGGVRLSRLSSDDAALLVRSGLGWTPWAALSIGVATMGGGLLLVLRGRR